MELTPYQTHASIALVGFGVSAGMAANVPLAAGCFGGLGALHLFLLARLAVRDWHRARSCADDQKRPRNLPGSGGGSSYRETLTFIPPCAGHVTIHAWTGDPMPGKQECDE